jgi:hypothetical protein
MHGLQNYRAGDEMAIQGITTNAPAERIPCLLFTFCSLPSKHASILACKGKLD